MESALDCVYTLVVFYQKSHSFASITCSISDTTVNYSVNVGSWWNLYFENLALDNYKFGKTREGITFILACYYCWKVKTT